MILKPDNNIPIAGYRMEDRQSVEALQLVPYIAVTRNNVNHPGNGSKVNLLSVPNMKDYG